MNNNYDNRSNNSNNNNLGDQAPPHYQGESLSSTAYTSPLERSGLLSHADHL